MEFIELQEITKTYHLGEVDVPVLKGVSLTVRRSEMVALMGVSGSGKSTLMNILGCLDRPSSGKYWLDGAEVSGLTTDQRAMVRNRKIGFVFQSFNLLPHTSALENVMMPLTYTAEHLSDREARQRARDLGLKFLRAVHLCRAAWPDLVASGGTIINIAGIGGRTGSSDFTIGGAVNAALLNLTKSLADRGVREGVRVNALNPGSILTDRLAGSLGELHNNADDYSFTTITHASWQRDGIRIAVLER